MILITVYIMFHSKIYFCSLILEEYSIKKITRLEFYVILQSFSILNYIYIWIRQFLLNVVLYTVVLKIAKNVFGEDSQKMCLQTMANVKEVALKESYIDAHKYPT